MAYEQPPDTGSLFKNKYKEDGDKKPEFTGEGNLHGRPTKLAIWVKVDKNGQKYLFIKASEPETKQQTAAAAPPDLSGDDFPF